MARVALGLARPALLLHMSKCAWQDSFLDSKRLLGDLGDLPMARLETLDSLREPLLTGQNTLLGIAWLYDTIKLRKIGDHLVTSARCRASLLHKGPFRGFSCRQ